MVLAAVPAVAEPLPGYRYGGGEARMFVQQNDKVVPVPAARWFASQKLTWLDRVEPSVTYSMSRLPKKLEAARIAKQEARADRSLTRKLDAAPGDDRFAALLRAQLESPEARLFASSLETRKVPQILNELSPSERRWLYAGGIARRQTAPVYVAHIDAVVGKGLFARGPIRAGQAIGEYTGRLENGEEGASENGYLFNVSNLGVIDGAKEGGVMRFANHSRDRANAMHLEVTLHGVPHVVLVALTPIEPGTQILYDYGPHYWSKGKKAVALGTAKESR